MIREKRQARRQPLRYTAWIAVTPSERFGCVVADVSEGGARLDVNDGSKVPDSFVLQLSTNGSARRFCRVVWRKPHQVGVRFEKTYADASKPASSDDAAGVPAATEADEPMTAG